LNLKVLAEGECTVVTPPSDTPKLPTGTDLTSTLHLSALRSVPDFVTENSLLDSLSDEEFNILKDLSSDSAMFIALSGAGKGARFLLNTELVTIGRDPSSQIFLDDVTVSRKHCQVKRSNTAELSEFTIEDLNSLNGTYVNAISKTQASLSHGDEVQVGKYRLTFLRPVSGTRISEIH
jgi:pSer/pThr/pTyr-binding forkhead associated (FHA) protein